MLPATGEDSPEAPSTKNQAPRPDTTRIWGLKFGASLVLGAWRLELPARPCPARDWRVQCWSRHSRQNGLDGAGRLEEVRMITYLNALRLCVTASVILFAPRPRERNLPSFDWPPRN